MHVHAVTRHGVSHTLLICMSIVQTTTARVAHVREKNPTEADALSGLSTQLQLCAAAVLTLDFSNSDDIDSRLSKGRGRKPSSLPSIRRPKSS
jgi:hypothetical protein